MKSNSISDVALLAEVRPKPETQCENKFLGRVEMSLDNKETNREGREGKVFPKNDVVLKPKLLDTLKATEANGKGDQELEKR
jgi:hypothetical protein